MCGIIGYIGSRDAVQIILDGLSKLEYRGYDSAGLAVFTSEGLRVVKQKGRLAALAERLAASPLAGQAGIGHTRWATHGEPSDANSHPHLGGQSRIAIVHNGIIENYRQLKEGLIRRGVTFASETDSEVIAQLAEHYYNGDLLDTVIRVAANLKGSFALGIISLDDPDRLVAIRQDSPLIIGTADHGQFLASDVPAILGQTDQVYYLEDREVAVLTREGVEFYNSDKELLAKAADTVTWSQDSAEKGGYPHFMIKEIMEQPQVIKDTIQSAVQGSVNAAIIDSLDVRAVKRIVIAACGSAYNAGVVAKYVIERLTRLTVEVDLASEFRYRDALIDSQSLVVLISQSGETADTIAALREAKAKQAKTLGIVNVVGSTVAKEADCCLYTLAGPEIAVATTKAFSAQLALLYMLAIRFGQALGQLTGPEASLLEAEVALLPEKAASVLSQIDAIQHYASSAVGYKSIFFIGRNIDYAIALEGSLKLKEISYIHSEAYAAGELKHGTISLVEEDTLVVAIANSPRLFEKVMGNIAQVVSRGAKVLLVGSCPVDEPHDRQTLIGLPQCHELFSPSLSVIALQLFSYYVAANKGLDIDKPRNLAKSVTVE